MTPTSTASGSQRRDASLPSGNTRYAKPPRVATMFGAIAAYAAASSKKGSARNSWNTL
jgi:hypothetical protein